MTRRKQEGPLEGAFLLAHPCCTFTPASRCKISPALTDIEPDPEQPDDWQAKDALFAVNAKRELKRIEADAAIVRKLTTKLTRKGGASLLALVDLHEKTAAPRSYKTTEKARLYLRRFIDVVGDMPATDVTREHVLKFRDHLEANGYSGSNVAQHLAKLQALFNPALSEGIVKLNPAHKIKARKAAKLSGGKQGFDAAQMKRIFAALDGETVDFQWIVKLLAFHGARICQLKCGDVAELSGVDVIRIHDQNGSVKNRQSVRDVPLHPKCRAILAHAAKRGADAWLFPHSLTPSKGAGITSRTTPIGSFSGSLSASLTAPIQSTA